ncbi:MAG: ribbon-helix-helix protein, CopG family [Myxococcales bacterium]|nr:ribbon-helix-helix protein, CopG family [Myxococcales bacterium]
MTIRLSGAESARIATLAKKRKVSRSELVRQALAALERGERKSALDDWREVVGMVEEGPRDLATNPKHLKGFGRWRR